METHGKLYLTSDETVLLDPNYRYVISAIELNYIIKKGTIITVIVNINNFCKELQFDKKLLLSILGKKLSCKCGINDTNQYYLQGKYTNEQIKHIIYNFI